MTKPENLATATGTCRPTLQVLDLQHAFRDATKLRNAGLPMVQSQTD